MTGDLRAGARLYLATLLFAGGAWAQTFNSTSTGADGALDYTGTPAGTTIIFDPATHQPPLDVDGDNVYHFTTINIPANVTVKLTAPRLNYAPVWWLASGAVMIDGTLDLSGDPGHGGGVAATRTISLPGPGGYPGGVGGSGDAGFTRGFGPGGAVSPGFGGSYATVGNFSPVSLLYGNLFILPLIGGSGGAGNGAVGQYGGGGGAGGGAILIASSISIRVNGSIRSHGGDAGLVPAGNNHPGGAGSGGAIRLLAPVLQGSGSLSVAGGAAQPGYGTTGGFGRIRLEAFRYESLPATNGSFRAVTLSPQAIFLPAHGVQSVRVSTVDGVAVPVDAGGSFLLPDVTINKSTPVVMTLQAANIPLGTVVNLRIFSEGGADQILSSTPLTGTLANSVADASGILPPGFSRCFVHATWTP